MSHWDLHREPQRSVPRLALLEDRINRSEHHSAEQSIQEPLSVSEAFGCGEDMKTEMERLQEDISNLPEAGSCGSALLSFRRRSAWRSPRSKWRRRVDAGGVHGL